MLSFTQIGLLFCTCAAHMQIWRRSEEQLWGKTGVLWLWLWAVDDRAQASIMGNGVAGISNFLISILYQWLNDNAQEGWVVFGSKAVDSTFEVVRADKNYHHFYARTCYCQRKWACWQACLHWYYGNWMSNRLGWYSECPQRERLTWAVQKVSNHFFSWEHK